MMRDSLKQIVKDGKEYLRYLKYKKALPQNTMHDDIYIVEFPKSGITWLQHIIGNIELQLINKQETITFYNHHKYLPDIHQVRGANVNRILDRTFIKSHAEFNPYYYFVVYLIRNPYDVMVSYYNFLVGHGHNFTFEEFVKGSNGITLWIKHVNSWHYKSAKAQRIHLLKYENLLLDAENEIKHLYLSLGVSISDEFVKKALINSSLDRMSFFEKQYRLYNPNYNRSFVGKQNKMGNTDLLTNEIKKYITEVAKNEIKEFYPNLLN